MASTACFLRISHPGLHAAPLVSPTCHLLLSRGHGVTHNARHKRKRPNAWETKAPTQPTTASVPLPASTNTFSTVDDVSCFSHHSLLTYYYTGRNEERVVQQQSTPANRRKAVMQKTAQLVPPPRHSSILHVLSLYSWSLQASPVPTYITPIC